MDNGKKVDDKVSVKKFPFIVVGLSSSDATSGAGSSSQQPKQHSSSCESHPSPVTSHSSHPSKLYADHHESRTRSSQLYSVGKLKQVQTIRPKEPIKVHASAPNKKHTPFTTVNNGSNEPVAIQPQKPVRSVIRSAGVKSGERDAVSHDTKISSAEGLKKKNFSVKHSQGDFSTLEKPSYEHSEDRHENFSSSKGTEEKDFHDFHDWSLHEKFDELFATMRQREDEIFRLRTEIFGLKETISKNSAETGASRFLYQTMQKQLDTIEEKIELQESVGTVGGCESSVPVSRSCSQASIAELDFEGLIRAIKQLNVRVEQGQSMELCFTSGGASFKTCDGVNVTIYRNGILLGSGKDFMPYTSSRAKFFVQDIFDGFFPNEFQCSYPQGVYMIVSDQRNIHFRGDIAFSGEGHALNGQEVESLPKLVPGKHLTSLKQRQFSVPPLVTTPADSVAVMSASKECCKDRTASSSSKNCERLPAVQGSYEILLAKKISGFDDKLIDIKLRNIKNGRSYKFKSSIFAKVGEILEHLNSHFGVEADEQCILINSVPMGVLSISSATLSDYGIEKNTVLYFRLDKDLNT